MTVAERREQSKGVATITDCLPGRATPARLKVLQNHLQELMGRPLLRVRTDFDGRLTVVVFAVSQD